MKCLASLVAVRESLYGHMVKVCLVLTNMSVRAHLFSGEDGRHIVGISESPLADKNQPDAEKGTLCWKNAQNKRFRMDCSPCQYLFHDSYTNSRFSWRLDAERHLYRPTLYRKEYTSFFAFVWSITLALVPYKPWMGIYVAWASSCVPGAMQEPIKEAMGHLLRIADTVRSGKENLSVFYVASRSAPGKPIFAAHEGMGKVEADPTRSSVISLPPIALLLPAGILSPWISVEPASATLLPMIRSDYDATLVDAVRFFYGSHAPDWLNIIVHFIMPLLLDSSADHRPFGSRRCAHGCMPLITFEEEIRFMRNYFRREKGVPRCSN